MATRSPTCSPSWLTLLGVQHGEQEFDTVTSIQNGVMQARVTRSPTRQHVGLLVAKLDPRSRCWTHVCHVGFLVSMLDVWLPYWPPFRLVGLHVARLNSSSPSWPACRHVSLGRHVGLVVTMLDFWWPCERVGLHVKARASAKLCWRKASWVVGLTSLTSRSKLGASSARR